MESAVATEPGIQVGSGLVRVVRADITQLEVDALVFYAQPDLALGPGVGRVISTRGGASIESELEELTGGGPVPTGEAVATGAGKLPAKHIIHAVGPRFREADTEQKLRDTMASCFRQARELGVRSIAFPAMGAGYYGIPPAVSARVMREAIEASRAHDAAPDEIVICVLDTPQLHAFEAAFAAAS